MTNPHATELTRQAALIQDQAGQIASLQTRLAEQADLFRHRGRQIDRLRALIAGYRLLAHADRLQIEALQAEIKRLEGADYYVTLQRRAEQ